MKIGLFGNRFNESYDAVIYHLLKRLSSRDIQISIHRSFFDFLVTEKKYAFQFQDYFTNYNDLPKDLDFLISIGGDGTFLESVTLVRDSGIPIVGFNSGRLGFLANISSAGIDNAIEELLDKRYVLEHRSLVGLYCNECLFGDFAFALNELTIQKTTSSLITIHAYINDVFLNSYWTDGLIIATPTGSTAYSLSVGGPIVTPDSQNFIISPIAPHNLNVRPIIIPDSSILKLKVEGRTSNYILTLDSRSAEIEIGMEITVKKSPFQINLIKLESIDYFSTLRNKLMWGADKRN
ncbi:MAG TPA: NAD kinase [Bacteroidales bacterium]|nr:NAD kinase [Bacteroidales bacterium]